MNLKKQDFIYGTNKTGLYDIIHDHINHFTIFHLLGSKRNMISDILMNYT